MIRRFLWVLPILMLTPPMVRAQAGPDAMLRSFLGPSARALGMGGAYLVAARGVEAVVWNPAALARGTRWSLVPVHLNGYAENVGMDTITGLLDLKNDLETLADHVDSGLSPVQLFFEIHEAYNAVRDFAIAHGAEPGIASAPMRLVARLTPLGGFSIGPFGAAIVNSAYSFANIWVDHPNPSMDVTPGINLVADAALLSLTEIVVGYGHSFGDLDVGISVHGVRADFTSGVVGASLIPPAVEGLAYEPANQIKPDLTLGAIYHIPTVPGLAVAGVLRHVLSPSFEIAAVRTSGGQDAPFTFNLAPQFDVGAELARDFWRVALAVRNLNEANQGAATFHVGVEIRYSVLALRAGLDAGAPVVGLGLWLGAFQVDALIGLSGFDRIGVGIGFFVD